MSIAYLNEHFLKKDRICISPEDRGFLFADGVYEVVRWYDGFFYDMDGHMARLKRSLREIRLEWPGNESFPSIAEELIIRNNLQDYPALVYLQVTRGAAKRTHAFPVNPVDPTVYAFATKFRPDNETMKSGIKVIIRKDIRWSRCDIKSVSLLPNILMFQEATENNGHECIFVRDGLFTEASHSNAFFVSRGIIYTHPESEHILSGITRKNILRIANNAGVTVKEEAYPEKMLPYIDEAFISNTSSEVTPVIMIGDKPVGNGSPGPLTLLLAEKFREEITSKKAN